MTNKNDKLTVYDESLTTVTDKIRKAITKKHKNVSSLNTPKPFVKKKMGMEYVEFSYMREIADQEYPGWSWSAAGDNPVQFLGAEWVIVTGVLRLEDNGIMREFFSPGSARVQFKRGKPHTAEYVIDIDKNLASANTNGFKRAINRLGNIADDVYRKQDLTLSDEDIEKLEEMMEGLSEEWKDKIMQSVLSGDVVKPDLKKVMNRIDQLINEEQEKKDG